MGKVSDEDLRKIEDLKKRSLEIIYALGEVEFQKLSLELVKDQIKEKIKEHRLEETEFLTSLRKNYGNVNINIETGEF